MKKLITSAIIAVLIGNLSAQVKVSQLPEATTKKGTELYMVVQDGVTKKIKDSTLRRNPTFIDTVTVPVLKLGSTVVTSNAAELNILDGALVNKDELNYLVGAKSNIQDQLEDTAESHLVHPNWADSATINGWTSKTDFNAGQALDVKLADSTGFGTGKYVSGYDFANTVHNTDVLTLQGLGSAAKALVNFGGGVGAGTPTLMVDGTVYYTSVYVEKYSTITGVKFFINTPQAVYNQDNFNGVGLYSVSGTTYTQIAISANDSTFLCGGTYSVGTIAFTAPINVTPGVYYIAMLYNSRDGEATAAPKLYTNDAGGNVISLITGSTNYVTSKITSQTALPATEAAGDLTVNTTIFTMYLY